MAIVKPDNFIDFLHHIIEDKGGESYLGEPVSMREHMLQTAQHARRAKANDAEIIAALLHDIGHYWGEFGLAEEFDIIDRHHEDTGKTLSDFYLHESVGQMIGLHVAAKRYLCSTSSDYYDKLSPASKHTLNLQGGFYDEEEILTFQKNPFYKSALKVRIWDDMGKKPHVMTDDFESYIPQIKSLMK